jgi:hypothetical protein
MIQSEVNYQLFHESLGKYSFFLGRYFTMLHMIQRRRLVVA